MADFTWSDEQKQVLDSAGNTLVSASAGSGKTTVMIEKIFRLLLQGQDVSRILVMTFSKASAQDMKSKLVEKIYRNVTPDEKGEMLREQLDHIPFSSISTINGFCFSLIKKYFLAAKIDPLVTMLDENEQKLLLDECLNKVLEKETEKGGKDFFAAMEYFSNGRTADGFKNVILSLRSFLSVQEDPESYLKGAEKDNTDVLCAYCLDYYKKYIDDYIDDVARAKEYLLAEEYDKSDTALADLLIGLNAMREAETVEVFFARAEKTELPRNISKTAVDRGLVSEEAKDLLRLTVEKIKNYKKHIADTARYYYDSQKTEYDKTSLVLPAVVRVYKASEEEYKSRKAKRGAIDFNDAERAALAVLADEKCVEEIRKTYDYVFIDEYQDTNYLQEALLAGVTGKDNLFAVGDVKQAIYRFRYAEPKIFNERRKDYEENGDGESLFLNGNYRSCGAVLDFTNDVCSQVMTESFGGVDYKRKARLTGGDKNPGDEDSVRIYTYEKNIEDNVAEDGSVYRVKTAPKAANDDVEAAFIAETTAEWLGKEIVSTSSGKKRAATYGDFAVLCRKGKQISSVAEKLRAKNIPFYIAREEKTVLPEREALIDVLRVLVNDEDDIPLAHVLSGAPFYFTPSELVEIRKDNPKVPFSHALRAYRGEDGLCKKAENFFALIEKWRFCLSYMTVAEILREILSSGFDSYLLSLGSEIISQVNAFILFAEKKGDKMSVNEFLFYYDNVYKGNLPPAPADAVSVMTIHASKGLEFPIVFVPYTGETPRARANRNVLTCDRELGMGIALFDEENSQVKKNFATRLFTMKNEEEDKESEVRLMYVAFTRAKDRLVVTGDKKTFEKSPREASCIMDWLEYTRQRNAAFGRYFSPLPTVEESAVVCPPAHPKSLDFSFLEEEYAFDKMTKQCAKTTVTGLLEGETKERVGEEGERVVPGAPDGEEAKKRGTAMHAVLQYIDMSNPSPEAVALEMRRLKEEGIIDEETLFYADEKKIAAVLALPVLRRATEGKIYRERAFVTAVYPYEGAPDKVLVQGVIDLMSECADGTVMLVDYKMSVLGAEKLKLRYEKQILMYSEAIESILGKKVTERYLCNIEKGYCVKI